LQQLVQDVSGLLQTPDRLHAMRKQAQAVQKKNAADAVASMIMETRFDYGLAPSAREAWLPSLQT
jgi:UDP-N-acetylglucosamine:LPS N-acetylglucosamine transferase